jgi:hypothetical protein
MKPVEEDKTDLGLDRLRFRRRCTKVTIPITAKMAPLMAPPTIASVFLLCFLGDKKFVVVLAFIVRTGTLQAGFSQE